MLSDDTLQRLTREHRRDREREALAERTARQARAMLAADRVERTRGALIGRLVAARRHALS